MRLFLRWYPDANIGEVQVIEFLRQLRRHLRGRIIIIWDRLNAHRSKRVRAYAERSGRIALELLPPYAPHLNPIEGVWGNLKYHRMANHGLDDVWALHARGAMEAAEIAARPSLLRSFVRATPLPIRFPTTVY